MFRMHFSMNKKTKPARRPWQVFDGDNMAVTITPSTPLLRSLVDCCQLNTPIYHFFGNDASALGMIAYTCV